MSVALVVAINPVLMALALPSVIMQRRYLMRVHLEAHGLFTPAPAWLRAYMET